MAQSYEKEVQQKIDELKQSLSNGGLSRKKKRDVNSRIEELGKSLQDFKDMREDKNVFYNFVSLEKDGKPCAYQVGYQAYINHIGGNMGSVLHESRHGGDGARRKLDLVSNTDYNVNHEVSAYRAQYVINSMVEDNFKRIYNLK